MGILVFFFGYLAYLGFGLNFKHFYSFLDFFLLKVDIFDIMALFLIQLPDTFTVSWFGHNSHCSGSNNVSMQVIHPYCKEYKRKTEFGGKYLASTENGNIQEILGKFEKIKIQFLCQNLDKTSIKKYN